MRFVYTWLVLSLGLTVPLSSQTLASCPLDNSNPTQATAVATGLTASDFNRGNGISELTISGPGLTASGWTTETYIYPVDYFEFCLTVDSGMTADITDVQFTERRSAEGIRAYELYYSTDGFASQVRLDSVGIPDNLSWRAHSSSFSRKIKDGEQLCFRLYGYAAESDAGEWTISSNSLMASGSLLSNCSPPAPGGQLSITNIEENSLRLNIFGGDGDARLILLRQGAPVAFSPYQGDNYSSNVVFGTGDQVGPDTYVVGLSASPSVAFTVSNLIPGVTYQAAVYEYDYAGGPCYASTATTAMATTNCSTPTGVRQLVSSTADGQLSMTWETPYCFEEVLVVASESPLTGLPPFAGGIALYNRVSQEVVQYIAYRHASAAQDGPAAGMFAPPIQQENGSVLQEFAFQELGQSMQWIAEGECPSEFTWGVSNASPGDLNGAQNVLPVQLLAYWAETKQKTVQLHWQTVTEEDSHYYEIEHRENGRTFRAIGRVDAAGFSQQQENYQHQHHEPNTGLNYYRLVQYDFDGSRYDLGVLSVTFHSDKPTELTMAPNPARAQTQLSWNFPARQLVIIDATGQIVHHQTLSSATRSFLLPVQPPCRKASTDYGWKDHHPSLPNAC